MQLATSLSCLFNQRWRLRCRELLCLACSAVVPPQKYRWPNFSIRALSWDECYRALMKGQSPKEGLDERGIGITRILRMAVAKLCGVGSHRNPVRPLRIVSLGPPLLQAITGRPLAMASRGTMPKCSLVGVYSRAVQAASRAERCWSLKEGRNQTCAQSWMLM